MGEGLKRAFAATRATRHTADQVDAARRYVADMISIMEKYGSAPTLTHEQREKIVADVLNATPLPR